MPLEMAPVLACLKAVFVCIPLCIDSTVKGNVRGFPSLCIHTHTISTPTVYQPLGDAGDAAVVRDTGVVCGTTGAVGGLGTGSSVLVSPGAVLTSTLT